MSDSESLAGAAETRDAPSAAPDRASAPIKLRLEVSFIAASFGARLVLVDRAVRRHQERDSILDLLDGQYFIRAEPWHIRTRKHGLGVIYFLVDRLGVG